MADLLQLNEMDRMLEAAFVKKEADYREEGNWIKLHNSAEPIYRRLGNAFCLYFYMRRYINRSDEPTWAKLDKYYGAGFLAFARHQSYIAEDFGVTQPAVSKWLKLLVKKRLVTVLGTETITRGAAYFPITIYSLGRWKMIKADKREKHEEMYYADFLTL